MELEKNVGNSILDEETETPNPITMLLQPIINLWSNDDNEEKEELNDFKRTDENDHSSATNDSNIVFNDDNDLKSGQDELHKNQAAPSEMDILEEALNESPEKFIDTILAMNNASSSPIVVKAAEPNHEKSAAVKNDSFGQQILAQAGAQLMQQESAKCNQNIEYSTQKEEKIGNNFCINRTTTFHLEPANFPLKL
uniref:Uncharacterized protein n=1 Tax=Panagrolaimus davidi TaxID=227884 RepID=A0A914PND7_9BILA